MIHELASGKRAFIGQSKDEAELILQEIELKFAGSYAPLPEDYSPYFRNVVAAMMHVDPDQRPDISSLLDWPGIEDAVAQIKQYLSDWETYGDRWVFSLVVPSITFIF